MDKQDKGKNNEFITIILSDLDEVNRSIKEISMMFDQSKIEVGKLSQKNASFSAQIKQIQKHEFQISPDELQTTFSSAMEAQQRLFVMRGQSEKLQSDLTHLERYKSLLERTLENLERETSNDKGDGATATLEMLVNAQETERQRLSRQMHDGPAQALSNFILQTEIAMRLLDMDVEKARTELGDLRKSAMNTFQHVRNYIFELRPMMLDDLGLIPTVRKYADVFKEQSGIEVNLSITGSERRLEPYMEVMIFRALQELLGNASRHSQANLIKVQIDLTEDSIKFVVDDNGKGFDPKEIYKEGNLGLKLIKERVELLGGQFEIESYLGTGSRVIIFVPIG